MFKVERKKKDLKKKTFFSDPKALIAREITLKEIINIQFSDSVDSVCILYRLRQSEKGNNP